ncbi:MAG: hypothetical protein KC422_02290 [Trueperaceae bacterium]|nr:hypothetical protein [Trueperaceae bacterium]
MYLDPLWIIIGFFFLLAVVLFSFAGRAFRRKRIMGGLSRGFIATIFLLLAVIAGLLSFASWGYKALTLEQTAATVDIVNLEPGWFRADLHFSDGSSQSFRLAGDQLYLDAKILKWHPYANLVGFKTLYEFDRVGGRYSDIDDELNAPRTLFSLETPRNIDLFDLSKQYDFVKPLVDAQYGSGTFGEIEGGKSYKITVSTSGLIMRELAP